METCVFCDQWGSAANADSFQMELKDQIEKYHANISKKYNSRKFLIYYQAYTNTFTRLQTLKQNLEVGLHYPFVVGYVIGTRPDCLSKGVFDLWKETHEKSFVGVELGVQSFFNHHLEFMKRGHTAEDSLSAIRKISQETPVDLGIHLIFGNPNETDEEVIETAQICNDLPITNVKLHHLHVLKNTGLEQIHAGGQFTPISFEKYAERIGLFLSHLHPRLRIHRLAAYSSRWEELIAPDWTADKMRTHQGIIDYLRSQKIYQGLLYHPVNETEVTMKEEIFRQSLIGD